MLTLRVFLRDLQELARSHAFLAILIVVPLTLLVLIGQVDVRPITTRVAIVTAEGEEDARTFLHDALQEISAVTWVDWPATTEQIAARATRERIDLVAVWANDEWTFYQTVTHAWRAPPTRETAQLLMFQIARNDAAGTRLGELDAIEGGLTSATTAGEELTKTLNYASELAFTRGAEDIDTVRRAKDSAETLGLTMTAALAKTHRMSETEQAAAAMPPPVLSAGLAGQLTEPLGFETSKVHALVPGYIVLIGVFVPFVLASLSLVRERAHGTFPALLVVTRRQWVLLATGKLALPVFAGVMISLLLIVSAHLLFDIGIKPGLSGAVLTLLLSATASAMAGLAVSAWLDSTQAAYAACAVYLVCLILLTGMVHPIEQSAPVAVAVAHLFSFTVAAPAMEEWMAAGALSPPPWAAWRELVLQIGVSFFVCAGALSRLQCRL